MKRTITGAIPPTMAAMVVFLGVIWYRHSCRSDEMGSSAPVGEGATGIVVTPTSPSPTDPPPFETMESGRPFDSQAVRVDDGEDGETVCPEEVRTDGDENANFSLEFEVEGADRCETVRRELWNAESSEGKKTLLVAIVTWLEEGSPRSRLADMPDVLHPYWDIGEDIEEPEDDEGVSVDEFSMVADMFSAALDDSNPDVRDEALALLPSLPDELRDMLLQLALCKKDPMIRASIVESAKADGELFSALLLMKALDDENADVAASAAIGLEGIFGQRFSSTEQAESWWDENSQDYLVEIQTEVSDQEELDGIYLIE